jgi:hypothetical protein
LFARPRFARLERGQALPYGRISAYVSVMSEDAPLPGPDVDGAAPGKALTPAARRALEEAAARRAAAADAAAKALELGGPTGPEPTRYGDWERKGIAVDF